MTEEMLEQARNGNRGALGTLLDRHRGVLRALAIQAIQRELGQEVDPSDLVRQTLLQAHHGFAHFQGESDGDWLQWLQSLMQANIASVIEYRQPARREIVPPDQSFDVVDAPGASEAAVEAAVARRAQQRALEGALDDLPSMQGRVVRLRLLRNWNLARISQHMDIEEPLVAGLLRRGIRTLRETIASDNSDKP